METNGFKVDKIVKILELDKKTTERFKKMVLEMVERQELDEKLHNLAMRGVNENRT